MLADDIKKCIGLLSQNLTANLVYMLEHDFGINFILVSNGDLSAEKIAEIEIELSEYFKCEVNVLDMNEFDTIEKADIMKHATLIHCKNDFLKKVFEVEVTNNYKLNMENRSRILERKTECATFYLQ